jgi:hypothetical protein
MSGPALDRRTLLLGTSLFAAMGVSAKSLATDASLPMKVADIDRAFKKAFNAGDLDKRSREEVMHIYPVAARGFPDHLRRCPSEFDILPIG